ncbi:MAG: cytochrome C [Nitrospiraceae bacterium]|nr:MAG: cytochrome C [Nitrospiraceae bacterium]
MKKYLVPVLTILIVGLSSLAMAAGNGAGILNSPHDFSAAAWNSTGEICVTCHTPHDGGRASNAAGMLWNHDLSAATYTMYDSALSSSLDGAVDAQPTGVAKLCLACHDGTVALEAFGKNTAVTTTSVPTYAEIPRLDDNGNEDLRGTHPISIVYDDVADVNLNIAASTPIGTSGVIADVLDVGGKLQCHSCHDVHDQEAVAGTALLRVSNAASALCLTCHLK